VRNSGQRLHPAIKLALFFMIVRALFVFPPQVEGYRRKERRKEELPVFFGKCTNLLSQRYNQDRQDQ
jgi:hypothetical protein